MRRFSVLFVDNTCRALASEPPAKHFDGVPRRREVTPPYGKYVSLSVNIQISSEISRCEPRVPQRLFLFFDVISAACAVAGAAEAASLFFPAAQPEDAACDPGGQEGYQEPVVPAHRISPRS